MKTLVPEILFAAEKAKEVALFFFNKMDANHMNAIVLAQLMYKVERESYQEYGCGITMDQLIQGEGGPMLKHTHLWLLDNNFNVLKEELIRSPKKSDDQLMSLSDSEVDLLNKNWLDFSQQSLKVWQKSIVDFHESKPLLLESIFLEDLFSHVGFTLIQAEQLVESILARAHIEKIFKSVPVTE